MFQLIKRIDGTTLWANLHLLFWLSLVPFTTAWMDESDFARTPVVTYGVNLLAAGSPTTAADVDHGAEGPDSALRRALGSDVKGKLSPVLYILGIAARGQRRARTGFLRRSRDHVARARQTRRRFVAQDSGGDE